MAPGTGSGDRSCQTGTNPDRGFSGATCRNGTGRSREGVQSTRGQKPGWPQRTRLAQPGRWGHVPSRRHAGAGRARRPGAGELRDVRGGGARHVGVPGAVPRRALVGRVGWRPPGSFDRRHARRHSSSAILFRSLACSICSDRIRSRRPTRSSRSRPWPSARPPAAPGSSPDMGIHAGGMVIKEVFQLPGRDSFGWRRRRRCPARAGLPCGPREIPAGRDAGKDPGWAGTKPAVAGRAPPGVRA